MFLRQNTAYVFIISAPLPSPLASVLTRGTRREPLRAAPVRCRISSYSDLTVDDLHVRHKQLAPLALPYCDNTLPPSLRPP